MDNYVIILGGGASVIEGIEKGLWERLKDTNLWSINFAFKVLPYEPAGQLWLDESFFSKESLGVLALKCTKMTQAHPVYKEGFHFEQYKTTIKKDLYYGKDAIAKNLIFKGKNGLTGFFALSMAIAKKYTNIFLLGYDWNTYRGLTHWYQKDVSKYNIKSTGVGNQRNYINAKREAIDSIAGFDVYLRETDVKIYNVTAKENDQWVSKIGLFERINYDTFFQLIGKNDEKKS